MLTCQIAKRLGSFQLDIDLQVGPHVTALFGPSGSGKSLTLQAIAGLITPDRGQIAVGDRTLYDAARGINLPPQQRRVGYVFQNYALFPHLTVAQNIGYGLGRLPRPERRRRVAEALQAVRLDGLAERRPGQLSGGQQQRVGLARALVMRPDILLLDEPFAALDRAIRLDLHGQLLDLLRELAIPTLLVTHQLEEAYALSRSIAVYEAGRILCLGPRADVYNRPQSAAAARHLGFRNSLPGVVEAAGDAGTRVRAAGQILLGPPTALAPGQPVCCLIRPEHVLLVRPQAGAGQPDGALRLTGTIVQEISYGADIVLSFRAAGPAAQPIELQISLLAHIYDRLGVAGQKDWEVALHPRFVHIVA